VIVAPHLGAIYDAVPESLATPLTVAASVTAAAGAGLILAATIYGSWMLAAVAGATFAVAGVLWHGADHASQSSSAST
jgi:hypothetical protein